MCRHVGYLGRPRTVAAVLTSGEHSLLEQSWAPRQMRGGGTVNADGFGASWWTDDRVGRYRSARPIWSDAALGASADPASPPVRRAVRGVLEEISSTAVLAAVRSATVGMPITEQACAPFTDGRWAMSHNGVVRGWPHALAQLAGELDPADALTLDAPTDSAFLWELLRGRLHTESPAAAMRGLILDVESVAPGSRLNLLLGDGTSLVGSAWDHSLWCWRGDGEVWVASEPVDERPGWMPVPDRHLVVAGLDGMVVQPIGSERRL